MRPPGPKVTLQSVADRAGVSLTTASRVVNGGTRRVGPNLADRVHQAVAIGGADLNEANFFGVGVEAVGLGVQRKPFGGLDHRQKGREFFLGVYHCVQFAGRRRV